MNREGGFKPTLEIFLKILSMQIKYQLDFKGTVPENGDHSYSKCF